MTALPENDTSLVKRVQAGEEVAFERLLLQYKGLLKRGAALLAAAGSSFDDAMQELALAFHAACLRFQADKGAFPAFASAVIRNRVRDGLRRRQRMSAELVCPPEAEPLAAGSHEIPADPRSAENALLDLLAADERAGTLHKALKARLSDLEYTVLTLRSQGLSYVRIAAMLRLDRKQVYNAMQRSRRKLRHADFQDGMLK